MLHLLGADLLGDDEAIRMSLASMRAQLAQLETDLELTRAGPALPHRARYLRLINDLAERTIAMYGEWLDEVDRRAAPDPLDSMSPPPGRPRSEGSNDMSESGSQKESPSQLIDARIEELGDWRGELLARLRALVKEADPDVVEEWKWRGVPTWYHDGMLCTGETYKAVVKMTFAKGAALEDPSGLFNSSLEGNVRRAIDFREGEAIDEAALKALVRAAVELNTSRS